MKNKVLKKAILFLRKNKFILAILIIFLIGAFLRSYHFSDWLHFELDQSRDAKIIDLAVEEGVGNLPLLGPKAAGSFLRLGPIFYYFNYLSALVFGNTPSGIAMIIMIFGILAIPAFYFFIRRYFEKYIAFSLTLIFSLSLFLIMYSRFSWNPNALPLFIVLSFYCLLRSVDMEEEKKGIWLLGTAFFLAIVTQLHFLAFLAAPVTIFLFLALKRPRIKLQYWLASILVIFFFYAPVIINDFKTGGDNIKEFAETFTKKSTKDEHNSIEKLWKNTTENSLGYFLVLTAISDSELPRLKGKDIQCDGECRKNLPFGVLSLIFWILGVILTIIKLKKYLLNDKCKQSAKKDFIVLISIWIIVSWVLFYPIAYDIAPRFWLFIAPIPFIFLGLCFEKIGELIRNKKLALGIILIIFLGIIFSNLINIAQRFSEIKNAPEEVFNIDSDKVLKERNRVTLEQQLLIIDYIESIYEKNSYPVYINSDTFYQRALLYHLEKRKISSDGVGVNIVGKEIYENGNYFLIYPTSSNTDKDLAKYAPSLNLTEEKNFGTMTVFYLVPKKEAVTDIEQEFGPAKKPTSASGVPVRCRWNEIFGKCNLDGLENEDE